MKPDNLSLILEAAQKRFALYGLKKTTMTDIAEDIGMSKASLYYYFTNKEELFKEVVKKEQAGFISQIDAVISSNSDSEALLITYVKERLLLFQNFINLSKLSSESIKSVKPIFSVLFDSFQKEEILLTGRIIQKGIDGQEFKPVDIIHHAELFIALAQGLRRNIMMKKDLMEITNEDYQLLEKQFVSLAIIFGEGLKK